MLSNFSSRFPRRKVLLFLIPAVAAFIAGCATGNPQDTFDTAGPVAKDQADLFKFIFWIAVVVFVIVEVGIIWITLKYRRRSESEMPVQTHGNTKLELTWTFIPALIIVAIAIPTVISIWDLADPPADESVMTVEAIGHQWWFEFRYPEEEIITANELRVPVGQNVVVKLTSQDVIHSFWVPKLFGKVDMVPTRDNELWFRADEAGEFFGQCAEFCGIAHALMRFRVIAEPEDEFNEWVAGMRRPPVPSTDPAISTGRGLFVANCSMCHSVDSHRAGAYQEDIDSQDDRWDLFLDDSAALRSVNDNRSKLDAGEFSFRVSAPNLTHFGTRNTLGAGITPKTKENLIDWITDPSSLKQGTHMQDRAFVYDTPDHTANLAPDQVEAIADYLLSLVPGEADAPVVDNGGGGGDPVALGQSTFETNCSFCHSTSTDDGIGPGLEGLAGRAASTVSGLSADEYIRESIVDPGAFFVEGFGPAMPGQFGSQFSTAEIDGLIAYIKTLN